MFVSTFQMEVGNYFVEIVKLSQRDVKRKCICRILHFRSSLIKCSFFFSVYLPTYLSTYLISLCLASAIIFIIYRRHGSVKCSLPNYK